MKTHTRKNLFFLLRLGATAVFVILLLSIDFDNPANIVSVETLKRLVQPSEVSLAIRDNLVKIKQVLATTRPGLMVAALLAHLCCIGLLTARWQVFLKLLGIRLAPPRLFGYYLIGFFFNNFLPTNIGGDIARVYHAGKHDNRMAESFAAIFMDRFVGFVSVFMLALVAILIFGDWLTNRMVWALMAAFAFAIAVVLWVLFDAGIRARIKTWIGQIGFLQLNQRLSELYRIVYLFRNQGRALTLAVLISVIYQMSLVVVNLLAARAVGLEASFAALFFIIQITTLICLIPITINGLGIREGFYVTVLATLGIGREKVLAFQVILLLINYLESLAGGLCLLVQRKAPAIRKPTANETVSPR